MWASLIILTWNCIDDKKYKFLWNFQELTSFAPSPIAKVTAFLLRFISATTNAFCSGVTRQQITALHCDAISRNFCSMSIVRQCTNECPLTTIANPDVSSPISGSFDGDVKSDFDGSRFDWLSKILSTSELEKINACKIWLFILT